MKRIALIAVATVAAMGMTAQVAYETPRFGDNWSIGIDGGVTTPLKDYSFFGDMRGAIGLHVQKQISPAFALGIEGVAGINTSSWNGYPVGLVRDQYYPLSPKSTTAFDNLYVGAYGSVNLFNLFGGYKQRLFDIEVVAGAGWGHDFVNHMAYLPVSVSAKDENYFVTKAGLNFNFNVWEHLTISLKPYVAWNMTGTSNRPLNVEQASAAYNGNLATINCLVGVTYNFGPGFKEVQVRDQKRIDELNAEINALHSQVEAKKSEVAANEAKANALAAELAACQNRKPEVIKEVSNNLSSVRYVFYRVGSSKISADQQPNVEMVASYLKNHKDAKVVVKGYASPEGNLESNKKLAAARAESVKNALVKKYGIASDRISAVGEGIGDMFSENDWNRVAICTLE